MNVKSQVNVVFRQDGPEDPVTSPTTLENECRNRLNRPKPFPLNLNVYQVNKNCELSDHIDQLLDYVWNHEDAHRQAAVSAGKESQNDVHKLLEPLVANSEYNLHNQTEKVLKEAHRRIFEAACATHDGGEHEFVIWLHEGYGTWKKHEPLELDARNGENRQCPE